MQDLNQWASKCLEDNLINLAPNTAKMLAYRYNKHVRPMNFSIELSKVEIQTFINTLPAPNDKKVLALISSLLGHAVDFDLIERNPCVRIKTKRYVKPERLWVPFDELKDYGNEHGPTKYNRHVRFMASTGMRLGEALALTDKDIEQAIDTGWLTINKSWSKGVLSTPKSGKARKVPYMGFGTTFPRSRVFQECLSRVHGQGYTIHSLRYTYAHLLACKGVRPNVAQRFLGHSTIALTLDLYTGMTDADMNQARSRLLAY